MGVTTRRSLFGAAAALPALVALPTLAAPSAAVDHTDLLRATAWLWLLGFRARGGTIQMHRDVVFFGYDPAAKNAPALCDALHELNGSLRFAVNEVAKVNLKAGTL